MMSEPKPARILYVEDNAGLARLFQKNLERAGYAVDLARDGEEGLAKYEAGSYDIVAVDYMLPVYDGLELIRQFADRGPLPPTIMLTGHGDEAIAVEAMKLGASDYIVKDVEGGYLELLPSVIERLLQQQRLVEAKEQAVVALRESEERFRAVAESASDAIISFDHEGAIFFWNQSAETIFGYSAQEAIGKSFTRLIAERFHWIFQDQINRLRDGSLADGVRKPIELISSRKDGSEFPSEASFSACAAAGQVYYTSIIRDITSRKRAERALQAAARLEATTTLAGGIAHQFNNLMVGVLGNAELLQMQLGDRLDLKEKLIVISKAAQKAGELAQQMLAFARGGKYQPVAMNLNDSIEETLKLQERSFSPRIQVECQLAPDLWNTEADPTQMTQMVMNFCTNAIEAIQVSGRITIATKNVQFDEASVRPVADLKPGRYVCLTIEDTGSGMSAETLARVFEPFFSTKFTGRGLGLAAVYGIVRNHGGHITVTSQEGQGTTFTVYLPASGVPVKKTFEPRTAFPKGSETILVVDDEEIVLSITRQLLERLGYQVLVARNGKEAIEIVRSSDGPVHLTLLDMSMPVMSGVEAYPLLIEAQPSMKVILCSGYDMDASTQALLDAGASTFLRKPFGFEVLAATIRQTLDETGTSR